MRRKKPIIKDEDPPIVIGKTGSKLIIKKDVNGLELEDEHTSRSYRIQRGSVTGGLQMIKD
jgi:hypothetical protein